MKRAIAILLLLLLATSVTAGNKAILIGVSRYPCGSGWSHLNSDNDVDLLKEILLPRWEVSVLKDDQATYEGIVRTLKKVTETLFPGDTIIIHFSGHGQQMLPLVEEQTCEPDMLDEAIVPYDAKKDWSESYNGEKHLRDNEFGELVDVVRDKAGINGLVVVILDACHSDSMQRTPDAAGISVIYRGTSDIFGQNVTAEHEKKRFIRDTSKIVIKNNAACVYLSACQANSKNAEITTPQGVGYGSLSYSVAGALMEGGMLDLDAFLDRVVMAMDSLVPYQRPGIRASFDYQLPERVKTSTLITSVAHEEKTHSKSYLVAVSIVLALLIITIWRAKKK